MSESKPYVEVVIRFYPEAPIKQHTIDYIRGRAHDYAGSMLFAAYRNPRVVSVKRRTPMADPLALNPEERALARQPKSTGFSMDHAPSPYIEAIKKYRIRTGALLKDAKERVDDFRAEFGLR
jgi:hypothetical protein